MIMAAKVINVAARACVVKQEKLLLVSYDNELWHLPGGLLEPSETLEQCAIRETYEETGYKVALNNLIYTYEYYDERFNSHKIELVFKAQILSSPNDSNWNDLGEDNSVKYRKWFSLSELNQIENLIPKFLNQGLWLKKTKSNIYSGLLPAAEQTNRPSFK